MTDRSESRSAGLQDLITARALWTVRADAAQQAIDAATLALTEGVDSGPLRELAGAAHNINVFEQRELIDGALTNAGIDTGDMTENAALRIAARHYATCVQQGRMSVRELTGWAHRTIGHEGPQWAQELVELDDKFDEGWVPEPEWAQTLDRLLADSDALTGPAIVDAVTSPTASLDRTERRRPWAAVGAAVGWFALWYLTPGLHARGLGSLFTTDEDLALLIEIIVAGVLAVVIVALHRRYNRELFARDWSLRLYIVPAAAAIALPFHYEIALPLVLYMVWWVVSVFWQDYLTFGLLQKYLAERLPTWAVLVVSSVVFWLGHVIFLPDRFGFDQPLPSLAILALGFVLGGLRLWLGTLHLILALHLTFYYILA